MWFYPRKRKRRDQYRGQGCVRNSMCSVPRALVLFLCVLNVFSENCKTPNNAEGECVSIHSCPKLLKALGTLRPEAIETITKHKCGSTAEAALVCCASSPTSTVPTVTENKMDLLPSRRYCGYQRFDDYFHAENDTSAPSIDEFPWLAALVYDDEIEKGQILCQGSLISNRYVLTLVHCLVPTHGVLAGIRLGEYNIAREEDCLKIGQYDTECTGFEQIGVEEIIVHPGYKDRPREHNVGLARLNKSVTYTDFIRPICLPFPGKTTFAKNGDTLYESGWGRKTYFGDRVIVKKKIPVQLLPIERCIEAYKDFDATVDDFATCTLESRSGSADASCAGDGGDPVMFKHRNQWHLEGMFWFRKACPFEAPNVNFRVAKYLDWILENIRP